jgi:hypothetical protein
LAFASLVVPAPDARGQAPAPTYLEYSVSIVLLGDSYTAGNGAGQYYDDREYLRSHRNWGENYARWLRERGWHARLTNLARNGDWTDGVLGTSPKNDTWGAQVEENPTAIENADLIMMTIGGNNLKFGEVVEACFAAGLRDGATCKQGITNAVDKLDEVMEGTLRVFAKLEQMVEPRRTQVVLVGYPFLSLDKAYDVTTTIDPSAHPPTYLHFDAAAAVRAAG